MISSNTRTQVKSVTLALGLWPMLPCGMAQGIHAIKQLPESKLATCEVAVSQLHQTNPDLELVYTIKVFVVGISHCDILTF